MALIDRIIEKSDNVADIKREIKDEILKGCNDYLYSSEFEDALESRITKDRLSERNMRIGCECWLYHSGCSDTHFRCYTYDWHNPENKNNYASHYYKGIYLGDIQDSVVETMAFMLTQRLKELGFRITSNIASHNNLGNAENEITFSW